MASRELCLTVVLVLLVAGMCSQCFDAPWVIASGTGLAQTRVELSAVYNCFFKSLELDAKLMDANAGSPVANETIVFYMQQVTIHSATDGWLDLGASVTDGSGAASLNIALSGFSGQCRFQAYHPASANFSASETIIDMLLPGGGAAFCIESDGSIYPANAPVQRNGNVYTLLSDMVGDSYGVIVERDNVTLDGAGHLVRTQPSIIGAYGVDLEDRSNVTVRNMRIDSFSFGVNLDDSVNNTVTRNIISTSGPGMGTFGFFLYSSSNNSIFENEIVNTDLCAFVDYSTNNTIFNNDFINCTMTDISNSQNNTWDSGNVLGGNYWSDYAQKYPNASEIDSSGFWNTSYVIDGNDVDNFPLVNPHCWDPMITIVLSTNLTQTGSPIACNATVSGINPTGTISWTTNSTSGSFSQSTSTLSSATCSNNYTDTNQGAVNITATYNGDASNDAVTASVTLTVMQSYCLNVTSVYGSPNVASGLYGSGTVLTMSVSSPVWVQSGTIYTCTGWTGTGDVPSVGNTTSVTITVTQPSSIIWDWKIQHSVTIWDCGVGSDFTGTVATIDGTNYSGSVFPVSFWWDENSTHNLSFPSSLTLNVNRGYVLWSTTGISNSQNATLTIKGSGQITANFGLLGDINHDGKVSLADLGYLAKAYHSRPGDQNWNPSCDLASQGVINLVDLVTLAQHYGSHM